MELDTLHRANERLGMKLRPAPKDSKGDFVDDCTGMLYDAIGGGPNPAKHLNLDEFTDAFRRHFDQKLKPVDRVLLDVTGMTEAQKQVVRGLVNELSDADRARLIELGF